MQAYIRIVIDDVATNGVLPRYRYQLIQDLLAQGKLQQREQTWIKRLCYGVSNNLVPLVD